MILTWRIIEAWRRGCDGKRGMSWFLDTPKHNKKHTNEFIEK
jgi:hypothetical protein